MNILRNREVKWSLVIGGVITIIAGGFVFSLTPLGGLITLLLGFLFLVLLVVTAHKRYSRIRNLSEEIDQILHGEDLEVFKGNYEGDLSILEGEVEKMTLKLREQNRLLQKEKILLADSLADISHQLRTPLTTITMEMDLIKRAGLSEEEQRKKYQNISQHLFHIQWLITTLLKFSKLDAGTSKMKMEKVKVSHLVEKAIAPLEIPIELRGQRLVIEVEEDISFSGDLNWTAEAVGNVLKNCMEHNREEGNLLLKAKRNPIYVEITIEDEGEGIKKEDFPFVFKRFYQGENRQETGIGIGLAFARTVVGKENGTLKAENRYEGGARFIFRFYNQEKGAK